MLRFFDENKRSGKKIGIFLNDMARSILEQGSPNQTSLMDGGRATLGDIIESAERVARDGTTAASLFDDAQEAPAEENHAQKESTGDIQNANAASTADQSVETNASILLYKNKAQKIVSSFEKRKVNLTDARQEIKDLMAKANEARWSRKMTNDECMAAQGFLSDALAKINTKQAKKRNARNNNGYVFLYDEETFANLEDAFGIKPKPKQNKIAEEMSNDNELLREATVSEVEKLKAEIEKDSKELRHELFYKTNANPVVNPKIYVLGAKIGINCIRLGYKTFKPWAEKVLSYVGEEIRPWLRSIWNGIASMPKDTKFDEKKYTGAVLYSGNRIEKGMMSYDMITDDFKERYGEEAYNKNEGDLKAAFVAADTRLHPEKYDTQEGEDGNVDDSTSGLAE